MPSARPKVAIVDYGMGNLFSVQRACGLAGLDAEITPDRRKVLVADAVILPGVGAFGDAIATLRQLGLDSALLEVASNGKPLVGICLGLQLFMEESNEFGIHKGLGLFSGNVVRFQSPKEDGRELKIPQVGWNRVVRKAANDAASEQKWRATLLAGVRDGEYMYFVHSYIVQPQDAATVLTTTRYGDVEFCSSLGRDNLFGCQFHPERSGPAGQSMYRNLARQIQGGMGDDHQPIGAGDQARS